VVVARADVLLLQPPAAFLVQQVEGDGRRRLRGGKELDRNGDQSKGDGPRGNGTGAHGPMITWRRQWPTSWTSTGASGRPIAPRSPWEAAPRGPAFSSCKNTVLRACITTCAWNGTGC